MENTCSVETILNEWKASPLFQNLELPLGYTPGLPLLQIRNEQLCLLIPYLKYRVTGVADKTLVYPIRYVATLVLPEKKLVDFQDLSFQPQYGKVDFNAPVGLFRHEAIRHLNKTEYWQTRKELLAHYDRVIGALLFGEDYTPEEEEQMRTLLRMMVEPSQLPIYKALDEDFYNKYLV